MYNFKHCRRITRGLLVAAMSLTLSISISIPVLASNDVVETDLSGPSSPLETTDTVATTPTGSETPATKAKEDFSSGIKGVGNGFKNGTKATGRGFKKAGTAMGRGFKKAGLVMAKGFKKVGSSIKNLFVRNKGSEGGVQERDLAAETNLSEDNAAKEADQDLDAVGNGDAADDIEVDDSESGDWAKSDLPASVTS